MTDIVVKLRIDSETGKVAFDVKNLEKGIEGVGDAGKRAGKKVSDGMEEAKGGAQVLQKAVDDVKGAVIGLVSVAALNAFTSNFVESADLAKTLAARIDIVTDSQHEFNTAQEATFEIAQEARTALESTVSLYEKLERSTDELGFAQGEVLTATESITKSLKVSSATAQATSSVMTQLGQAFDNGVLRGEEFNSVADNGSRIMQALRDELGKTQGELREMAFAGELSAEIVINALINQSDAIAREFDKLPTKVEDAYEQLSNANIRYFGEVDASLGITESYAEAISFLADNIESVYGALGTTVEVIAVLAGAKGIQGLVAMYGRWAAAQAIANAALGASVASTNLLTGSMARLNLVIRANPLVAGAAAIYAAYEGFNALIDSHNEKIESMAELTGESKEALETLNAEMAKGFESDNIDAFTQSVSTLESELVRVEERLTQINDEIRSTQIFSRKDGAFFDTTQTIGLRQEKEALELRQQNITVTLGLANAQQFLTDTFGPLYQAAKDQIEADKETQASREANISSIDKWIEASEKQLENLERERQTYGKTKAEIIAFDAAKIKGLTTDQKLSKQIDDLVKKMVTEQDQIDALRESELERQEAVRESIKLYEERQSTIEQIAQSVETDEERINRIADEHVQVLKDEQAQLLISQERYDELADLIEKVTKKRDEDLNALDESEIARQQLLDDLELEERLIGLSNEERQREIISREALARGIKLEADELDRLVKIKQQEIGLNPKGGFLNEASFDGLIRGGETLSDILRNASEGFSQGIQGAANSMNVLLQGAQFLSDVWESTAGQDSTGRVLDSISQVAATGALGPVAQAVAQVANTINSLTGGRLFGTSYEVESATQTLSIGQTGASGELVTREVRQRSLFRGRQWRETISAIGVELQQMLENTRDAAIQIREEAGRLLGVDPGELVSGQFTQELDADGNLVREGSEFFGRFWEETLEQFQRRFTAENLISLVGSALPEIEQEVTQVHTIFGDYGEILGTFTSTSTIMVNEASFIAERWRHNADLLLDGAQLMLAASADIQNGNGLFESLTETVNIIEDLQNAGESLPEAYQRVSQATILIEESLEIMGISLDQSRDDFIRWSTGITEISGSLRETGSRLENYFENFYSEAELRDQSIANVSDLLGRQAQNLGIDPEITAEQFRQQFESAIPSLSDEDFAAWLEFSETLTRVIDLERERTEVLEEQAQALQEYQNFGRSLQEQIDVLQGNGPTDYQQALTAIREEEQQNIATLNELAAAAGLAGASEEDLARAHQLAALQTQQAINVLRQATEDIVAQLYGDDAINSIDQITQSQVSGFNTVAQAGNNLFSQWESAIDRIRGFTQSLLIDPRFSPLEGDALLAEAETQFYDAVAAANSGDLSAAQSIPALLQDYLSILDDVVASGGDYNEAYFAALAAANGIEIPDGVNDNTITVVPSPEQQAYDDQLRQQRQEELTAHRLELANQLLLHVADLSQAINQPVLEVLSGLGVDMNDLLFDLGISLTDANGQTIAQMSAIAQTLDINITQLGSSIGLAMGSLADAQSLLNDGLEQTIFGLPDGIQSELTPLLRDVEEAADGTAQEAALVALEEATAGLPLEYRNMLAPFFDNIDQTTAMELQLNEAQTHTNLLARIANNLHASNSAAGIPSYDVGTNYVPKDQLAYVHEGEMIIPRQQADVLRGIGVVIPPVAPLPSSDDKTTIALIGRIDRLTSEVAYLRRQNNRNLNSISDNTGQISDRVETISNQPGVTQENGPIRRSSRCGGG